MTAADSSEQVEEEKVQPKSSMDVSVSPNHAQAGGIILIPHPTSDPRDPLVRTVVIFAYMCAV